jgi:ribosome-binding ATPase YchF (GTP1/OBG family)
MRSDVTKQDSWNVQESERRAKAQREIQEALQEQIRIKEQEKKKREEAEKLAEKREMERLEKEAQQIQEESRRRQDDRKINIANSTDIPMNTISDAKPEEFVHKVYTKRRSVQRQKAQSEERLTSPQESVQPTYNQQPIQSSYNQQPLQSSYNPMNYQEHPMQFNQVNEYRPETYRDTQHVKELSYLQNVHLPMPVVPEPTTYTSNVNRRTATTAKNGGVLQDKLLNVLNHLNNLQVSSRMEPYDTFSPELKR